MATEPALLTGWGRTAATGAELAHPQGGEEAEKLLGAAGGRGAIPRGLGRSYGDAAQCAGGLVLDATGLDRLHDVDLEGGTVRAGGGVSLEALVRSLLPRGWFVPVTPGTRFVTVGGAVAADVHGKNHHVEGSFSRHVEAITLATPVGRFELAPGDDLFWATVGGMGLTGVVVDATIRLLPVETSRIRVDTDRLASLDEVLGAMSSGDEAYRYSVAWIDCLSKGRSLGRSVLTRGDHARLDELAAKQRRRPLALDLSSALPAPPLVPSGLLNRASVKAFNELWYRKAPRRRTNQLEPLNRFFWPLDAVDGWNRLYGPKGFVQYQMVVPFGAEESLREALERLSSAGVASFLAVLKRFGAAGPGHLSFPMPGWTLALDLPVGPPGLGHLLDGLDALVAEAGGRVYFAKDSRLRPDVLRSMYPRLDEWRAVRSVADPGGVLRSDLSRRLDLVPEERA